MQPLVKRVCDTDRLVCSKTCLNANDIAFVIDGSSSVGTGNFRTVLQFVANITREFEISDTDTRVGAVQYTYEQRLEFSFSQYGNKADLLNAIRRIHYWSGGTSTGAAISYASEQLFSKSKPNKRKIMIVITDGRSYDDVRQPAAAVHRQGQRSTTHFRALKWCCSISFPDSVTFGSDSIWLIMKKDYSQNCFFF